MKMIEHCSLTELQAARDVLGNMMVRPLGEEELAAGEGYAAYRETVLAGLGAAFLELSAEIVRRAAGNGPEARAARLLIEPAAGSRH